MKGAKDHAEPSGISSCFRIRPTITVPLLDPQARSSKTKFMVQSCQIGLRLSATACHSLSFGFLMPSIDISFDKCRDPLPAQAVPSGSDRPQGSPGFLGRHRLGLASSGKPDCSTAPGYSSLSEKQGKCSRPIQLLLAISVCVLGEPLQAP